MPADVPPLPPAVVWEAPAPKGVVLGIHGGGWTNEPWMVHEYASRVNPHWTRRGWSVYSTRYTPGTASLDDVLRVYDHLRRKYRRVIVTGESAGGHLALMIASRRSPYAVLVEGAITGLTAPGLRRDLADATRTLWHGQLRTASPQRMRLRVPARRVLLSNSRCDPIVRPRQMRDYARAHPGVRTLIVPCGKSHRYTHEFTTAAGVRRLNKLQLRTVR